MVHPLDRPIWSALTGPQAAIALGDDTARRFAHDVSPLAAAAEAAAGDTLAALIPAGDDISLLEPVPPAPLEGIVIASEGVCVQMVAETMTAGGRSVALQPLGDADAAEMLALALLTRPGPFRARTHTLGRFVGVREGGELIAMAGERLRPDGFVEVSGVCTLPEHRGKGLGAALIRAVGQRIRDEGLTPFLHSYAANTTAIALYRSLGFVVRCELTHSVWARPSAHQGRD